MKAERPFAVFDIDGTLLRWQMYYAIVDWLADNGLLRADGQRAMTNAYERWKRRGVADTFAVYEQAAIAAHATGIVGVTAAELDRAAEAVFEVYKDQAYVFSRDLVAKLKQEGYWLFAISGSHEQIVTRIGEYYGFDAVIGERFKMVEGLVTSDMEIGVHRRKGELLQELVASYGAGWQGSVAVGDTLMDESVLRLVDTPIAFNPNKALQAVAMAERWPMVIERKDVQYRLEAGIDGKYGLLLD